MHLVVALAMQVGSQLLEILSYLLSFGFFVGLKKTHSTKEFHG